MNRPGEDVGRLLTDVGQWTEPWGSSDDDGHCDKCQGAGTVCHECWSCSLTGADEGCPACAGVVCWQAACPVCRGSGRIDGAPRHGVSAFPTVEGLYRYMLCKDADLEGCVVVELEASLAEDVDFDADEGALLVLPSEIVRRLPVDMALARRLEIAHCQRPAAHC